jgi:hypothetical protein
MPSFLSRFRDFLRLLFKNRHSLRQVDREASLIVRLGTVLLVMVGVVAAGVAAVSTGAVKLPRFHHSSSRTTTLTAQRTAANRQWASAFCTNLMDWKNQIQRDGTSLNPTLGPVARIKDATAATTRLLGQLDTLGFPPGGQSPQARAEASHLRSVLRSRARKLQADAADVARGNLASIGSLVTDLNSDKAIGTEISNELQRVVSVDLGLSLAETGACRHLVGIPI